MGGPSHSRVPVASDDDLHLPEDQARCCSRFGPATLVLAVFQGQSVLPDEK